MSDNSNQIRELCEDVEFKTNVQEYESRINTLGDKIKLCCESGIYPKLSIEEKVKYDLFLSYSLTSLYWIYLRTQGEDPSQVKSELDRVKKYMDKSKQIHDRKSMPRIDKAAASRFVRSGLWDSNKTVDSEVSAVTGISRKRKHNTFNDDDT
uniref:Nuclear nucleic acid-binding protein C1D n=1 Tax=Cuerna arida TaxID=1464854 RepID=A0A1B6EKY4_9HEMI